MLDHIAGMTKIQKGRGKVKTKDLKYMKKFAAGKIIGLQNLIPDFQEKTEIVHFTDNLMVAELYEIDVMKLRKIINEDAGTLKALW